MRRRSLVVLLVLAVVCAGVGTGLLDPAGSGWSAVPRFRISSDGNGLYLPFDPTWLEWRPRIGAALLALGAGTAGATLVGLLHGRRAGSSTRAGGPPPRSAG